MLFSYELIPKWCDFSYSFDFPPWVGASGVVAFCSRLQRGIFKDDFINLLRSKFLHLNSFAIPYNDIFNKNVHLKKILCVVSNVHCIFS